MIEQTTLWGGLAGYCVGSVVTFVITALWLTQKFKKNKELRGSIYDWAEGKD